MFLRAIFDVRIFALCCLTAADVAFGQIFLQHALYLEIECAIYLLQPLGHILVHGGLAYAEVSGGSADGGAVTGYVFPLFNDALYDIFPHRPSPQPHRA